MTWYNTLLIVVVVAICTLMTRALPFMIFGGKRTVPNVIRYLGNVLPPAIMAVLVVYCMKNINFKSFNNFVPELIAALVVIGLHLWKRNTLLSIVLGTLCYMALVQVVFC